MTIDKQKLKALAEAATQSHGPRRVEIDHNGVHVIGDGSWKILSAWHTPDGKGSHNAEFAAVASPSTVLALLAEIERLEAQVRLAGVAAEVTVHQEVGRAVTREFALAAERDQLKAENEKFDEGMRSLAFQLGAGGYNAERLTADQLVTKVSNGLASFADSTGRLLDQVRTEAEGLRKDAERYRWLRDKAHTADWEFIGGQTADTGEAEIDAAMAKEASHG